MIRRAAEITAETGAFWTNQFQNDDMIAGYRSLGEELLRQLPGPPAIDALYGYIGTAGCFLGTTRALREVLPAVERVAVEPAESAVLSGGAPGTHHIEGGGIGYWPPKLSAGDIDRLIPVPEADAFAMARTAARTEGILSGRSTGANLVAALAVARELGPGHRVVTMQVDSGLKYLA